MTSIPELLASVGSNGARLLVRTVPAIGRAIFRSGSDDADKVHDFAYAYAGHALLNHPRYRVELADPLDAPTAIAPWRRLSRGIQYASHAVAEAGGVGLGPITRTTASTAARYMEARLSRTFASDPKVAVNRLAEIGLSPEDAEAIAKHYARHGGPAGDGEAFTMNPDEWTDKGLYQRLHFALYRTASKSVQASSPGDLPLWAQDPFMRVLMQFRHFPLVALQNHTLRAIHHRDPKSVAEFAFSLLGGLAMTAASVHLKAITADDPAAYRRENLAPDRLLLSALARTPAASLLPTIIDSAAVPLTGEPVFGSTGRSSGGDRHLIDPRKIPAVQTLNSLAAPVVAGASAAVRDDRAFTQRDAQDAAFFRGPGISQLVQLLTADLPR
ncbi:MAG: hypothetical protein AAF907_16635, partial [Planctomycetota bacterium]